MNEYNENRRGFLQTAKTVVLQILGGTAMFLVFLVSAFLAMRLAIHGREVTIPNLSGMTDAQAAEASDKLGLHLSVENRFYATLPVNHVLSQSPTPGSRVRRGWQIRVTESLGSQQVAVPDVIGEGLQPATLMLRRLQLEVGWLRIFPVRHRRAWCWRSLRLRTSLGWMGRGPRCWWPTRRTLLRAWGT